MWVLTLTFTLLLKVTIGQEFCPATGCCSASIMDTSGHVFLEVNTQIGSGHFNYLKVKLCTQNTLFVQLWAPLAGSSKDEFVLEWQQPIRAGSYQTQGEFSRVDVRPDANGLRNVQLRAEHRLGLYSPDFDKIATPYGTHPKDGRLFASIRRFSDPQEAQELPLSEQLQFETLPWPRSFASAVHFCNDEGCLSGRDIPVVVSGPPGPRGAPGPPGPPGPPGDITNCLGFGADDPANELTTKITKVDNNVDSIVNQLKGVQSSISSMSQSSTLTGVCPSGFRAGRYGIGHCYKILPNSKLSFGEAQIECWDSYQARLVDLEDEIEELFLSDLIIIDLRARKGNDSRLVESFWTAGMYSPSVSQWVWWDEKTAARREMKEYLNWAPGQPAAFNGRNNCMVLKVFNDKTHYWYAEDCPLRNSLICKVPKRCL